MAEISVQSQLVTFHLGDELYGIDIMEVSEIVGIEEIRSIPNSPPYVEGIFNLRGHIIPIINLHTRFHLKKAVLSEEDRLLSGFIIVNLNGMQIGIIIDKVSKVITVDANQIQPPPQMVSGIGSEYILGVTREENGYLIILDIKKLFDPRELKQLGQFAR